MIYLGLFTELINNKTLKQELTNHSEIFGVVVVSGGANYWREHAIINEALPLV